MSFFTNKHVIVALLAAPVLAVLTYVGVDHMVKPTAIAAQPGESFPLAARSNCRYPSGKCSLINGDFSLDLLPQLSKSGRIRSISLQSEHPIEGARFALLDANGATVQTAIAAQGLLSLQEHNLDHIQNIQLAIKSNGIVYYAETQTIFLHQQPL